MKITIKSDYQTDTYTFAKNSSLNKILEKYQIDIYLPCGGNATCGKCHVQFISGAPNPNYNDRLYLTPDELDHGIRLSCQCILSKDAVLELPEGEVVQDAVIISDKFKSGINPLIQRKNLQLKRPDLDFLKSDEELVRDAADKVGTINTRVLQKLPDVLRESNFHVTTINSDKEILDVFPGQLNVFSFGIALDIGSLYCK